MKKHIYLFLPLMLILCGCASTEKIDLLAQTGLEEPNEHFSASTFLPFSQAVAPSELGYWIKNPKAQPALLTVFNGVSLEQKGIYELVMRYVGHERLRLIISGSEYQNGKILKKDVLLNTMAYLNVNGTVEYRKKFAVSPECETLVPSLTLINPGKSGHATELLIEELSVKRVGTMKTASDELKKVNFASEYDFSQYPAGEFNNMFKGKGKDAKTWSDVKAEIVDLNGEKVLHMIRTPANYIYPYMDLQPFTVDPQYYLVKLTFKAKGKGSIKPGLWWKRVEMNWDYYHGEEVQLNNEWQTVTLTHPCLTPNVDKATISFTSKGDGEFWIKDISVNFL